MMCEELMETSQKELKQIKGGIRHYQLAVNCEGIVCWSIGLVTMIRKIGEICLGLGIFYSLMSMFVSDPAADISERLGAWSVGPTFLIVGLILRLGEKRTGNGT